MSHLSLGKACVTNPAKLLKNIHMPLTKPQLILFDVDETVWVNRKWERAINLFFEKRGIAVPQEISQVLQEDTMLDDEGRVLRQDRLLDGVPKIKAMSALLDWLKSQNDRQYPNAAKLEKALDTLIGPPPGHVAPYAGAVEFIQRCRKDGVKIGFVTTAGHKNALPELEQLGVYIPNEDIAYTRQDILDNSDGKGEKGPSYLKAAEHFGISPGQHVWVIDDGRTHVDEALGNGMTGILYGHQVYNGVDYAQQYISDIQDKGAVWVSGKEVPVRREQVAISSTWNQVNALYDKARSITPTRDGTP